MKPVLPILALLLALGSCTESASPRHDDTSTGPASVAATTAAPVETQTSGPDWALPGLSFLAAFNTSIQNRDDEMMLAFYHPDARLVVADAEGVATGWRQISEVLERIPRADAEVLLIGYQFAATLSTDPSECERAECIEPWIDLYKIWDGAIGLQIRAGLGEPESTGALHELYVDSAVAYSNHDIEGMRSLYSDAVFAPGFPTEEYEVLFESLPVLAAEPMTLADLGVGTSEAPALFDLGTTGPASPRARAALGVYTVTFTPTVEIVAATLWRLWDGEIVEAATLFDPAGWDRMLDAAGIEPPDSWYSAIELPEPRSVEQTHVLELGDGTTTALFNASDRTAGLVDWSFDRYRDVGLPPPHVGDIYMESERSCLEESAWTYLSETTATIRICLSDDDIAADDGFSMAARITILHELAHVWTAEHLSEEEKSGFAIHRGLVAWNDGSVPWSERGNEHAAEIIAWGLSDVEFEPVRIGGSSCEDLAGAFRLLTGVDPVHGC